MDHSSEGWSKMLKLNRWLLKKLPPEHPLLDEQGILHYQASSKAEFFADHLKEQFKTPNYSTWVDELARETIEQHDNQLFNKNLFFSPGKIWNIIKNYQIKERQA